MISTRPRRLLLVATVAAALVGCGGGPATSTPIDGTAGSDPASSTSSVYDTAPNVPASTSSTPSASSTPFTEATTTSEQPSSTPSTPVATTPATDVGTGPLRAVSSVEQLVVLDSPDGNEITQLPATTPFDTPTVVGVIDQVPGWVQVLVPIRPNDLTGWVRTDDVILESVTSEIHIDLTHRTLRLLEDGETTGEWSVAIGRSDRPTPTGHFFITDKLATGDPNSVWGAHAFGVSAYSDVLNDFIGGNGQIGVHGTNDPSSIGNAASSGCIRLPNEVIDDLIDRVPLGTPVFIS